MKLLQSLSVPCLLACALWSCGPKGVVKSDDAPQLVGSTEAGAEVYNEIVRDALEELLEKCSSMVANDAAGKKAVAFVGVENKSAEPLKDFRDAIYENVSGVLVDSRLFQQLSQRQVEAVLKEARLTPEQLFIGKHRDEFVSLLGKEGLIADYLLYATVTTESTKGGKDILGRRESERSYFINFELSDAHSGVILQKAQSKPVRKGYLK